MKKIINKKMYDTETAQVVGEWSNGYPCRDCRAIEETLYRKQNGEFFLHGWGGANTRYAEWKGDMVYDGDLILPLTFDEAREWVHKHLNGDKYEEIFGILDEGDNNRTFLTITLPALKAAALQEAAEKAGMSLSDFIDTQINIG